MQKVGLTVVVVMFMCRGGGLVQAGFDFSTEELQRLQFSSTQWYDGPHHHHLTRYPPTSTHTHPPPPPLRPGLTLCSCLLPPVSSQPGRV